MSQFRNILYETKKKAESRSSPFYNPVDSAQQLREQLKQLRNKNRHQQTQLIRLKTQVKQLRDKIIFYQQQLRVNSNSQYQQSSKMVNQMSAIPMIIENKQLKQQLEHLHQINLSINGKNRDLEAQNRQLDSDLIRMKTKLKELEILDKVRTQNFQRQVQQAKPVIIEDNKDFELLSESVKKIITFMRQQVIGVAFQIFTASAKQCEHQKKSNSYNIFLNLWNELSESKHLGYLALLQCLKSLSQVQKYLKFDKNQIFDINNSQYRDTLNEWIIQTLTQIKFMKSNEKLKEQKLFRLLGLLYRSEFPIKGQKYDMDVDVKCHFQQSLCSQIFNLLVK